MTDWPGEVPRQRVYGNFRPARDDRTRAAKALQRSRVKRSTRDGNDEYYLRAIRGLPCTSCGTRKDIQAHHLKSGPAADCRGVGMRSPDCWAVPLCIHCHADIERHPSGDEPAWFAKRGWNIFAYARALWAVWKIGGTWAARAMFAVYEAHRDDAHEQRLAAFRQRLEVRGRATSHR